MQKETVILSKGQQLTVTAAVDVAAGFVVLEGDQPGQEPQSLTEVSAGDSATFGPYNANKTFTIQSDVGAMTYSAADVDFQTAEDIDAASEVKSAIVNLTAASLSLTAALHRDKIVTVNKADGSAIELPPATGSGHEYDIIIGTTVTSEDVTIAVAADTDDSMFGGVFVMTDTALDIAVGFEAAGGDTITLDGSTTGGIKGDRWKFTDIAVGEWQVEGFAAGTGTEATPFSEAISAP